MAGEVIKEFLVSLGFKTDEQALGRWNKVLGGATLQVAGFAAAAVAAGGLVTAFVASVANEIDEVADLSERVNTAASEIERLGYIATLTDSSMGAVSSSLDTINRLMGEAATGVGRGAKFFEKYGLSVKKSNGEMKSTAEMMADISAYIKDMSKAEQVSVLSKLGLDPTMLKMMTSDTSALAAEFDALYGGIGYDADKAAAASSDFVDSQNKLKFVFDTLRKSVAVHFMPQITRRMETLRKMLIANLPRIMATVKPIMQGLLNLAGAIVTLGARIGQVLGEVITWLRDVNKETDGWLSTIGAIYAAWKLLNVAFLASPIGIILGLAAAIALLYDDYMTWKEGGDSLIDWETWGAGMEIAIESVTALAEGLKSLFVMASATFGILTKLAAIDFSGAQKIGENALGVLSKMADISTLVPALSGGYGGGTANMNANTTINVNGAGDPAAVGREVADRQNTVNKNLARNLAPVMG